MLVAKYLALDCVIESAPWPTGQGSAPSSSTIDVEAVAIRVRSCDVSPPKLKPSQGCGRAVFAYGRWHYFEAPRGDRMIRHDWRSYSSSPPTVLEFEVGGQPTRCDIATMGTQKE